MRSKSCIGALAILLALGACDSIPSWMGGAKPEIVRLPGERIDALAVSGDLKPDESLKPLAVAVPAANSNADWPQHSAMINAAGGNLAGGAFTAIDSTSIGDGDEFGSSLLVRPVVGGGLVFAMDGTGHISAHSAANIENKNWQSAGVSEEDEPEILGGGLAYDDGKLYAVSGRGIVAAFDAQSGKELWKKNHHLPFRSPPRIAGGKLFAITIDSQLFALNAASGEVLWTHRGINESGGIMNAVSPAVTATSVIVPYASGELYSLAMSDGREQWNESLAGSMRTQAGSIFSGIGGDPAVDGDVIFAVSSGGGFSVFAAQSGQRLWDRQVSSVNTPWIAGDFLFLLTGDNTLTCFVKYTGQIKWATRLQSFQDEERNLQPITWRGPVMSDGRLFVVGAHGRMVAVAAADGTILRTDDIPDDITTAPVIAGGKMYLVGKDAKLYVLQ